MRCQPGRSYCTRLDAYLAPLVTDASWVRSGRGQPGTGRMIRTGSGPIKATERGAGRIHSEFPDRCRSEPRAGFVVHGIGEPAGGGDGPGAAYLVVACAKLLICYLPGHLSMAMLAAQCSRPAWRRGYTPVTGLRRQCRCDSPPAAQPATLAADAEATQNMIGGPSDPVPSAIADGQRLHAGLVLQRHFVIRWFRSREATALACQT